VGIPRRQVKDGESPELALGAGIAGELGVTLVRALRLGRVHAHGAGTLDELEIRFFAAAIAESDPSALTFEKIAWALPKELGEYDFSGSESRAHRAIGHRTDQTAEILEAQKNRASQARPRIDSSYLKGPALADHWIWLVGVNAQILDGFVEGGTLDLAIHESSCSAAT